MKEKGYLSVGQKDLIKGFIVAILTVMLTGLITSLESGKLPDIATLKTLAITGLSAGLGYVIKNWLTNSQDQFLIKEPKKSES